MNQEDIIYLAGFFDGEGCVGIYANCLVVQITQNSTPESDALIEDVIKWYGGTMKMMSKKAWKYRIGSESSVKLLEDLLPYLRLKKEEVETGLEWHRGRVVRQRDELGRLAHKTPEEEERNLFYTRKIASLKSRNR